MRWKTSYFCILLVSPPGIILLDKQNQTWDSILTQKLKLNNYSCCQKSINDDHLGQGAWILIPNETPDKTPPGFHLKWNMFFISDQILSFLLFRLRRLVKKKGGVRALSRVPNTYDLVLSSVFRCLEPVMKHLPSFLTYYIMHKFVIHCFMVCCHWISWFLIIVGDSGHKQLAC